MNTDTVGQECVYRIDRFEPGIFRVTVRDGRGLADTVYAVTARRYFRGESESDAYRRAMGYARDKAQGHADRRVEYGHGVEAPDRSDADPNLNLEP